MPNYRVQGYIHMESTRDEADYDVVMEDQDFPPDPITIFEYLISSGEIQIIEVMWEEMEEK